MKQFSRQLPTFGTTHFWQGGEGPPLVLLHGAWGDAETYWTCVWNELRRHYSVLAPELPGFGQGGSSTLESIASYSQWLCEFLETVGINKAWMCGNSLGATVLWQAAIDRPDRFKGLTLVNGGPLPHMPLALRKVMRSKPGSMMVTNLLQRLVFGNKTLEKAFHSPSNVPKQFRETIRNDGHRLSKAILKLILAGNDRIAPIVKTQLIWGSSDRLATVNYAQKICAQFTDSHLTLISDAGHLPQLEQPSVFVDYLNWFAEG